MKKNTIFVVVMTIALLFVGGCDSASENNSFIGKLIGMFSSLSEDSDTQEGQNDVREEIKVEDNLEVQEKPAWDLTGNWCDGAVENGEPGVAAYITDSEMRIYFVSDKPTVYTPYRFGDYTVEEGKDSFSWTSTNNLSMDTDYPLYSSDETKDFTYNNGIISFVRYSDDVEYHVDLHRTNLDFSKDCRETDFGDTESFSIGRYNLTIPNSFGFFNKKDVDGSDPTAYVRFISSDGMLEIYQNGRVDDIANFSDSEYKQFFEESMKTIRNGMSDDEGYEFVDESDESIEEGFCHSFQFKYSGEGMITDQYMIVLGNNKGKDFVCINCRVSAKTSHDYKSDLNKLIAEVKIID